MNTNTQNSLKFAGYFETQIVGPHGATPWERDDNLVVNQGILYLINAGLDGGAASTTFYIVPFGGNVTPAATWTAANFTANATEFTNYTEATRQVWANDTAAANAIGNTTTPAVFTLDTGGGTIRGAGLISASAKSATTGTLIAAARFDADKVMTAGEELRIKYTLTGTSS